MSDSINRIANLITEDPDVFTKYHEEFEENTVLDEETYGEIVGILKDVAEENGLVLNHRNLKIKFNPAGMTIKNIDLSCPDAVTKRDLANRVAAITGDNNIKHTFNQNLKVNLYNAINREFADRVREELNLEITHQTVDPDEVEDPSEVLPMATFTQPAVRAEKPEEGLEEIEPSGAEPESSPEVPESEEELEGMGGGGLGGLGGLGGMEDLEGLEEPPSDEETEEPEVGPFGLEEPEGGAEEGEEKAEPAPPPEEGEEDELISFEEIYKIGNYLTEDPDIFTR